MKVLTFDIEEWFHIQFKGVSKYHITKQFERRLPSILHKILDKLDENKLKATFLCLGWIGDVYPHLIKEIHNRGHEIGSHTNNHNLIYNQKPREFRDDLRQSISKLSDLTGSPVTTFRAPAFSITKEAEWAFEILIEEGIKTDLSIFPASHDYGGNNSNGIIQPHIIRTQSGDIKELPMNFVPIMGKRWIYSGGGYFRLTPYIFIKHFLTNSSYAMCYFHPRDFDPEQPMLEGLTPIRKFKSYYGLSGAWQKFDNLTTEFNFSSVSEANRNINWVKAPIVLK